MSVENNRPGSPQVGEKLKPVEQLFVQTRNILDAHGEKRGVKKTIFDADWDDGQNLRFSLIARPDPTGYYRTPLHWLYVYEDISHSPREVYSYGRDDLRSVYLCDERGRRAKKPCNEKIHDILGYLASAPSILSDNEASTFQQIAEPLEQELGQKNLKARIRKFGKSFLKNL